MQTDNARARFALSSEPASIVTKTSRATWAGLFLSLFAMVLIRQAFVFFAPEIMFGSAIVKEVLIWVSAVALLVIIRRGEGLPLRSIGLGTSPGGNPLLGDSCSRSYRPPSSADWLMSLDTATVPVLPLSRNCPCG